jgi:transcriptional regulator with XRE-family HTH domain
MLHTMRALREHKGWSQTTLARTVGVSQTTIWYIERGERRPGPATRQKIAEALGVAPDGIAWPVSERTGKGADR